MRARFVAVARSLEEASVRFGADADADASSSSTSATSSEKLIAETTALTREHRRLEPLVAQIEQLTTVKREITDLEALAKSKDKEMADMAKEDLESCRERLAALEDSIVKSLVPREDADERSAIIEVRAGTGGLEASLFAATLYTMYEKYAAAQGWQFERMSFTESDVGGIREASALLTGAGVFGKLKFEAGVHRVQRVPTTEAAGRVHTSTATVAILPEAEEVDVQIDEKDLKIDVFRARGAGGQSVNKTGK